jgi:hypothetical protein
MFKDIQKLQKMEENTEYQVNSGPKTLGAEISEN